MLSPGQQVCFRAATDVFTSAQKAPVAVLKQPKFIHNSPNLEANMLDSRMDTLGQLRVTPVSSLLGCLGKGVPCALQPAG